MLFCYCILDAASVFPHSRIGRENLVYLIVNTTVVGPIFFSEIFYFNFSFSLFPKKTERDMKSSANEHATSLKLSDLCDAKKNKNKHMIYSMTYKSKKKKTANFNIVPYI